MQPLAENTVNIPAFLSKLWKMVNDPATDQLICWSPAGNSFIIQNQAQFWYKLLPLYYKHNNMSSFVRQLNMYGFHKMSTYENGTMDADKGEIQFFHPCFQKSAPELLKNIKRKVTTTKSENIPSVPKSDELARVLADVKYLRGKQANVDSQLNAMKQENAVLWRELAMLRQKHMKQQQIVNKLIQFLMTIVQPNTRMSGLGVKRRYPLMLNENPEKKAKNAKDKNGNVSDGPTIHELDTAEVLSDEFLASPSQIQVQSPQTPKTTTSTSGKDESSPAPSLTLLDDADSINPDIFWDTPEFVSIDKDRENILSEELLKKKANLKNADVLPVEKPKNDIPVMAPATASDNNNQKVFLNPTTQDTMLSNLINGSYNKNVLNGKIADAKGTSGKKVDNAVNQKSVVAVPNKDENTVYPKVNSVTKSTNVCFSDDLDLHLENTQSELDQFKDILNGASSVDANALLGLFSDDYPEYGLTCFGNNKEQPSGNGDPFISGSELATYDNPTLDFDELFDTADLQQASPAKPSNQNLSESINTPQAFKEEPLFPLIQN